MMDAYKYTNYLIESLIENTYKNGGIINLYREKLGASRLAREYAYGLKDFCVKCQDKIIKDSYMLICYRYYQCNPPIKLNEWCSEICIALNR